MVQFRRNYVHGRENYGPRVRTRVAWALPSTKRLGFLRPCLIQGAAGTTYLSSAAYLFETIRNGGHEKAAAGRNQRRLYAYSRGTLLRGDPRLLVIFMRGKLRNASHCCSIRVCFRSLAAMLGAQRKP
jgi:hypothetical protein